MSLQVASSLTTIAHSEIEIHYDACNTSADVKLSCQDMDSEPPPYSMTHDEPERERSPDTCVVRKRTESWLSVATDFDDLTCPGAQAEKCEAYCEAVYRFMPFVQPVTLGSERDQMATMTMPFMVYGGTTEQLQAQADELSRVAGQLMTAAQQAQEQAMTLQMEEQSHRSAHQTRGSMRTQDDSARRQYECEPEAEVQPVLSSQSDNFRTTVMLRNLPNDYTRDMLLELLNSYGFHGLYDFVYLPIDFKRKAGLGYAFVNMTTPAAAERIFATLQGFSSWQYFSSKVLELSWGEPLQGLDAHIDRYRNSPVMHTDVPAEFKPLLFNRGLEVPFPGPTKKIERPRMKVRQTVSQ